MKDREFINELRNKSDSELKEEARRIADELMKLGFRRAVGREENVHQVKALRRNLARVHTIRSEKCLEKKRNAGSN
ncbi:MAG: 50S ribosomal protein L29 [Bdellovibrionota bacterium]|jgi:large subunit ribosomal protein L29